MPNKPLFKRMKRPAPNPELQKWPGLIEPPNVDPYDRPALRNPDGSYSTASTISIGTDRGEVVIPTVVEGKRLTEEQAIQRFRETGEHLGILRTPEQAESYAQALHDDQARLYSPSGQLIPEKGMLVADPEELAGRRKTSAVIDKRGDKSKWEEFLLTSGLGRAWASYDDWIARGGFPGLVKTAIAKHEAQKRYKIALDWYQQQTGQTPSSEWFQELFYRDPTKDDSRMLGNPGEPDMAQNPDPYYWGKSVWETPTKVNTGPPTRNTYRVKK